MDAILGSVDIGGNKIAVGLVSESGELLTSTRWETDPTIGCCEAIIPIADALKKMAEEKHEELIGVGCGVTGPVDFERGFLGKNAFLPKWEGDVLIQTLIHELHLPVFADNDAIATAMGEYLWGAGKRLTPLHVCATFGTGIGVSFVRDDQPYRGVDGSHPEAGHMVVDVNSTAERCFCGARGCWESLASGTAMEKRWLQEHGEALKVKQITDQARAGNEAALEAVETMGRYIGVGVANLVSIFTPKVICLGGGVMGSYDLFLPYIEEVIAQNCGLVPHQKVQIKPAQFKEKAGLLGAAAIFPLYSYRMKGLGLE
jgi:glucokinase